MRDGITLSQVRLAGGNAGISAGAQSYAQVVYILDEETLADFRRGGKISLHGTLNYARRGESVTNTFGKISPTQALYTTIFNQSGYLAGLSLDGTFMQLMRCVCQFMTCDCGAAPASPAAHAGKTHKSQSAATNDL